MAKRATLNRVGQKKRASKTAPSSKAKSAGSTSGAKADINIDQTGTDQQREVRKTLKSNAGSATKNKTGAATASSSKRQSASKKGGNNGLLPKVPVKSGRLGRSGKLRKTRLKPEELEEFRRMLIEKRSELVGDLAHLRNEATRQGSSGETNSGSVMPIHMADIGSDTWEQELTMGLIENERSLIREIDEALERINDKTYGICLATNKPISKSRLRVKPWAKYCIEYARQRELGLV